jgi:hypothetical protein
MPGLLAGEDAQLRELSRHPAVHGVGEFGAQLHRAHLRIDGAAGEVELAVVGGHRAVLGDDLHSSLLLVAPHASIVVLGKREADPHRVHLRERGEQRRIRVRGDEAALGTNRASRNAADGRGDLRIREIELGLLEVRFRRGDGGRTGVHVRGGLVELALRDGLLFGERHQALGLAHRELALHALLLQRRARLLHRELVGSRVDLEERAAGGNGRAFVEEPLLEDARHARADFHLARSLGLAHRLDGDGHLLLRDLHHRDRHRRRRRALRGGPVLLPACGNE